MMLTRLKSSGYTLLEILITFIFLGIVTFVAANYYFFKHSENAVHERILMSTRIAHARTQGILRGGSCLTLHSTSIIYGISNAPMSPPDGEGAQTNLTDGVTLSSVGILCFDALGCLCSEASLSSAPIDSFGRKICTATTSKNLTFSEKEDKVILEINADGYASVQ